MNNNNKHKECIGCGAKFKRTAANTRCVTCRAIAKTSNKDKGGLIQREYTPKEKRLIEEFMEGES